MTASKIMRQKEKYKHHLVCVNSPIYTTPFPHSTISHQVQLRDLILFVSKDILNLAKTCKHINYQAPL